VELRIRWDGGAKGRKARRVPITPKPESTEACLRRAFGREDPADFGQVGDGGSSGTRRDVASSRAHNGAVKISRVDPEQVEPSVSAVLRAQAERWGAPLLPYLLYARRPTIFRAVRGMWGGIDASGLIDAGLKAMVNRRVAMLNGCPF